MKLFIFLAILTGTLFMVKAQTRSDFPEDEVFNLPGCNDYSLYQYVKGNPSNGTFPIERSFVSFTKAGQVFRNSSNYKITGMIVQLANTSDEEMQATAHLYEFNDDTIGLRLTWNEFEISPSQNEQTIFIEFDNPAYVEGDFILSVELLDPNSDDRIVMSYGDNGREENLAKYYLDLPPFFSRWTDTYDETTGDGDWDWMIFPTFEVDFGADLTVQSQLFLGDTLFYDVDTLLSSSQDSMMNYAYWSDSNQLSIEIKDSLDSVLVFQTDSFDGYFLPDTTGTYSFKHTVSWLKWSTYFDMQTINEEEELMPVVCEEFIEYDIEVVKEVVLSSEEKLDIQWSFDQSLVRFDLPINGQINIYGMDGRLINTEILSSAINYNLNGLKSGVYLIEVIENTRRSVIKIVR